VPSITVLDLQNNHLEDAETLDVLAAMPMLAVAQMQGNPFLPKVTQYRRNTISRCRALSYLDDRPVFEEERLAVDAWVIGGLPAEREERRRQRQEKDTKHRANLEFMMSISKRKPVEVTSEDEEAERQSQHAEFKKRQEALIAEEKITEKQMYDRALGAVERKRAELLRRKKEKAREEARAEAAARGVEYVEEEEVETPAPPPPPAEEPAVAAEGAGSGSLFADQSAQNIVDALETELPPLAKLAAGGRQCDSCGGESGLEAREGESAVGSQESAQGAQGSGRQGAVREPRGRP